jgi:N-methylhydantoinase B
VVQVRSDRFKSRPWGLFGGGEGAAARAFLNPRTSGEEKLPSKFIRTLRGGDVFRAEMAGAGGYGDPCARDPEAVLHDLNQGKITVHHAREVYGVVVDALTQGIDHAATAQVRKGMASKENAT